MSMGIPLAILIVCLGIYICNLVMLNKINDTIDGLRKIKQCLQDMVKSKEE